MNRQQFLVTSIAILLALSIGAVLNSIFHVRTAQAEAVRTGLFAFQDTETEPIATIGHGGFFDHEGRQIVLTLEFVAQVQDWYRANGQLRRGSRTRRHRSGPFPG